MRLKNVCMRLFYNVNIDMNKCIRSFKNANLQIYNVNFIYSNVYIGKNIGVR